MRDKKLRLRKLRRASSLIVGGLLVAVVLLSAVFADQLATVDPGKQNLLFRLKPPMSEAPNGTVHLLGTDGLGRDIFSRILYAQRVSLLIGAAAVVSAAFIGSAIGLVSGYYRGRVDQLFMRLVDIQISIPFLILALALVAMMGAGMTEIVFALAVSGWPTYARAVRSEVLNVREQEYVQASVAVGAKDSHILWRHVFPNARPTILVLASLEIGRMILSESSLSYLGFGLPPHIPTLGGMIAEGQPYIYMAWWVTAMPGIALFALILGLILVGDGLREFIDPKLKNV